MCMLRYFLSWQLCLKLEFTLREEIRVTLQAQQRWSQWQLVGRPWILARPRFPKYFALHHTPASITSSSLPCSRSQLLWASKARAQSRTKLEFSKNPVQMGDQLLSSFLKMKNTLFLTGMTSAYTWRVPMVALHSAYSEFCILFLAWIQHFGAATRWGFFAFLTCVLLAAQIQADIFLPYQGTLWLFPVYIFSCYVELKQGSQAKVSPAV